MKYKNLASTLTVVFFIVLIPLLAEYFLLTSGIPINDTVAKLLIRYQKIIVANRLLLCFVFYALLFFSFQAPTYKGVDRKPVKLPRGAQFLFLVICLVGLYCFMKFERTPFKDYYKFAYPSFLILFVISLPLIDFLFVKKKRKGNSLVKRKKINTPYSVNIKTTNAGYINIPDPFYHTLILAGSGSGKSVSVITPHMKQYVQKEFCGLFLDFKFPKQTNEINTLLRKYGSGKTKYYIINFNNLNSCHRINPLQPEFLRNVNYCEEIAIALYNNLDKESIKKLQFFEKSAVNWLTAVIWFFKKHYPDQCTLPHVLNTILYHDYKHVISMLLKDPIASDYVRSITTAIEEKAEKQLAGQIASLQNVVTSINTPELTWILSGNDVSPNLNDPNNPIILSIGLDQQMIKALAPCVSVILTVCLKQMNLPNKHHSFAIVDEAHSVFIPDLAHISAVCRDHKLSLVLSTQDKAQFAEKYGKEQMEIIFSNMSNRFYGKINHYETAKMVSDSIGMEEREIIGKSEGSSLRGDKASASLNQNFSIQEKLIARPEDIQNLKKGEFIGITTDSEQRYFWGQIEKTDYSEINPIQPFIEFVDKETRQTITNIEVIVENHYKKIKSEVEAIILSHPKVY